MQSLGVYERVKLLNAQIELLLQQRLVEGGDNCRSACPLHCEELERG